MKKVKIPGIKEIRRMNMSDIVEMFTGKNFMCNECGQTHFIRTKKIVIQKGIFDIIQRELKDAGIKGKCLVVFDKNTYTAAGEKLMESLQEFGPRKYIFDRDDLHADSHAIGRVLLAMCENPDFLVSCGSGTITDIVRYSAFMTKTPFVSFGTAASVDGYASSSTPVIVDGFKTTYPGCPPVGVFADTEILSQAPKKMTAAGLGDVLAKTVAAMDWKLARDIEGEKHCPLIAAIVERGVDECVRIANEISKADSESCGKLMQVLALTGIAMQMMGTTRPASGGDHHISHLLEMRDIREGKAGTLHGDKVGIGTLISLYMYHSLFKDGIPEQRRTMPEGTWQKEIKRVYGPLSGEAIERNEPEPPKGEIWESQKKRIEKAMNEYGFEFVEKIPAMLSLYKRIIEKAGGPVYPHMLGYSDSDTYDAIAFGKEIRPKVTILRIAERYGHLYELAEKISKGLPKGEIY